jgi:phytoene dehydrogenase-like protein
MERCAERRQPLPQHYVPDGAGTLAGSTVVVIGAGHNGLTAACYLARAGRQVTVLEARPVIGGMTSSLPLIPQAPRHLVSQCAIDAVYWKASTVEQDLGLREFGLKIIDHDPAWAWLGDDGSSLVLSHDLGKTVEEVRRFSPADAGAYAEFAATSMRALAIQDAYGAGSATRPGSRALRGMLRGVSDRAVRRLLGAALTRSAAELIADHFRSEQLRGAFAAMASILGSITQDSSGIGMMATAPLHRYGVARPVGGIQAIPDALRRCLEAAGGTVRCSSRVERVVIDNGRARGVELASGEVISADWVVSAVPPQVVAGFLAGSGTPGVAILSAAPSNAAGIGCFKLDLAFSDQIRPQRHQRLRGEGVDLRRPTLFTGTLEQVIAAEAEAKAGQLPAVPPLTVTILSATDPTQAPPGQDTVYAYAPAPVRHRDGWPGHVDEAAKCVREALAAIFGDTSAAELGHVTETPLDLETRLGAVNGCIYHVDQVATRIGPLRPGLGWAGHRTPVPGLVLSGAGTHPGGGVSGIPGKLAAQALLRARSYA